MNDEALDEHIPPCAGSFLRLFTDDDGETSLALLQSGADGVWKLGGALNVD